MYQIKKSNTVEQLHFSAARGQWVPRREASVYRSEREAAEAICAWNLLGAGFPIFNPRAR